MNELIYIISNRLAQAYSAYQISPEKKGKVLNDKTWFEN